MVGRSFCPCYAWLLRSGLPFASCSFVCFLPPPASGLVCLRGRAPHVTFCVQLAPGEMELGLALQLLRLPLDLGEHPTLGGPVELKLGKFGPYVEHANQAASLPKVSRAHRPVVERKESAYCRVEGICGVPQTITLFSIMASLE
jgi:hypothetical protein